MKINIHIVSLSIYSLDNKVEDRQQPVRQRLPRLFSTQRLWPVSFSSPVRQRRNNKTKRGGGEKKLDTHGPLIKESGAILL